jgi:hypothetical protein
MKRLAGLLMNTREKIITGNKKYSFAGVFTII